MFFSCKESPRYRWSSICKKFVNVGQSFVSSKDVLTFIENYIDTPFGPWQNSPGKINLVYFFQSAPVYRTLVRNIYVGNIFQSSQDTHILMVCKCYQRRTFLTDNRIHIWIYMFWSTCGNSFLHWGLLMYFSLLLQLTPNCFTNNENINPSRRTCLTTVIIPFQQKKDPWIK